MMSTGRFKKYIQYNIMNLNAEDIIFKKAMGEPLSEIPAYYDGTMPHSLETDKLNKICKGELKAFRQKAGLNLCNAVIDVDFTRKLYVGYTEDRDYIEGILREDEQWFTKNRRFYEGDNKEEGDQKNFSALKIDIDIDIEDPAEAEVNEEDVKKESFKRYIRYKAATCIRYLNYEIDSDTGLVSGEWKHLDFRRKERLYLYEHGFDIEVINGNRRETRHYVMYKRSANKAKKGKVMFIWDKIYDEMIDWTRLGADLGQDEVDLAGLKSYETLVQSSIEGMIRLEKKNILLVDDVMSPEFYPNISVLEYKKTRRGKKTKNLVIVRKNQEQDKSDAYPCRNDVFDGQALLDTSVFDSYNENTEGSSEKNCGMLLLRNSFFKACAFNVRIRDYYSENGIKYVYDMFGGKHKAKDILLIITPNALKWLKFSDKFKLSEEALADDEHACKKRAYEYWLEHISYDFGVVKSEHESGYGHGAYNKLAYQVINSLPLSREDIEVLLEPEKDYMKKLKSDDAIFIHHVNKYAKSVTKDFMTGMYMNHEDFANTREWKDYRKKQIMTYKEKTVEKGHIKVEGDFYTICSMPVEMLVYSAAKRDKDGNLKQDIEEIIKPLLSPGQVYNSRFSEGQELAAFRYPNMCASSAMYAVNHIPHEYEKYLNFNHKYGSNILVVCPWQDDLMTKLGGADFDSDQVLCISNKVIVEAAKKVKDYPVIHVDDDVRGEKMTYPCNNEVLSWLDTTLTDNRIGSIANMAQLLNSYYWDEFFADEAQMRFGSVNHEEYLKELYDMILLLAASEELEIDKAKHQSSISPLKLQKSVKNAGFNDKKILDDVKPLFYAELIDGYNLSDASGADETVVTREFNCPMDNLYRIVKDIKYDNLGRSVRSKVVDIEKFFVTDDRSKKANRVLQDVRNIIAKAIEDTRAIDKRINAKSVSSDDRADLEEAKKQVQDSCIQGIDKLKRFDVGAMRLLIWQIFAKNKTGERKWPELFKNRRTYLAYLYEVGKLRERETGVNTFAECIRDDGSDFAREVLIPDEAGDIVVWGERFRRGKLNK